MTDDDRDPLADLNASPLNPLPGVIWLVLLVILGIEAVLWAGGAGLVGGPQAVGWRIETIQRFAFSSGIQDWMLQNWRFPTQHLIRYFSFNFIHGTPMHALFGVVLVAALGKTVAESFGAARFVVLVLVAPLMGAAIFGLITRADHLGWLFGAMPMAFALVGAFTWIKWREAAGDRTKQRRAFAMIGILVLARLAFGLLAEAGPAWIAEVASFALGFAGSALVLGPGSWARLRERICG
ncbi:rhomboid family intramembrane serine protease [Pararhodobacter sp.]|uniref:rhomboid family intramembrane serine protease n=1 Tax=Pararhodobacter sp. TaxID=2127056 RepID=UPI002AFF9087|nr:rhomboid family intramembrane serine protease [Pararhodobacter sp.]